MNILVFGYGYSAAAAARRLQTSGARIIATTRSPEKAAALAGEGIEALLFDGHTASPALLDAIAGATHILSSVQPVVDAALIGAGRCDPVLAACGPALAAGGGRRIVYLSTIGVYGDAGGAWVDEETAPAGTEPRVRARLAAEAGWFALGAETGSPVSVLRLSGIYGPGRNVFVNLSEGTARRLVKPGQVFNRIHVDDIATAVDRAFSWHSTGLFNITDDEPAPPQDVIAYAAGLMGIAPPPEQDFATAELTPMARSFYGSNKRVSNRRSKQILGLAYAFPDYRRALASMWADGSWR